MCSPQLTDIFREKLVTQSNWLSDIWEPNYMPKVKAWRCSSVVLLRSFKHKLNEYCNWTWESRQFFWFVLWHIDYSFSFFKQINHEFKRYLFPSGSYAAQPYNSDLQYYAPLSKHSSTYELIYVHLTLTGAMKWSSGCLLGQVTREFCGFQTHMEFIHRTQENDM